MNDQHVLRLDIFQVFLVLFCQPTDLQGDVRIPMQAHGLPLFFSLKVNVHFTCRENGHFEVYQNKKSIFG